MSLIQPLVVYQTQLRSTQATSAFSQMISHLHIKYELNKYDGIITFCDKIIRRLIWPKKKKIWFRRRNILLPNIAKLKN